MWRLSKEKRSFIKSKLILSGFVSHLFFYSSSVTTLALTTYIPKYLLIMYHKHGSSNSFTFKQGIIKASMKCVAIHENFRKIMNIWFNRTLKVTEILLIKVHITLFFLLWNLVKSFLNQEMSLFLEITHLIFNIY